MVTVSECGTTQLILNSNSSFLLQLKFDLSMSWPLKKNSKLNQDNCSLIYNSNSAQRYFQQKIQLKLTDVSIKFEWFHINILKIIKFHMWVYKGNFPILQNYNRFVEYVSSVYPQHANQILLLYGGIKCAPNTKFEFCRPDVHSHFSVHQYYHLNPPVVWLSLCSCSAQCSWLIFDPQSV